SFVKIASSVASAKMVVEWPEGKLAKPIWVMPFIKYGYWPAGKNCMGLGMENNLLRTCESRPESRKATMIWIAHDQRRIARNRTKTIRLKVPSPKKVIQAKTVSSVVR